MCVVCSISLQILMPILLAFAAKTGVALQPRAGDRFEDNAESPCINCSSSSNIYIYIWRFSEAFSRSAMVLHLRPWSKQQWSRSIYKIRGVGYGVVHWSMLWKAVAPVKTW